MSTKDLYKMEKNGCEEITEELLSSMYETSPTEAFEKVGTLSGEFCLCQGGLCNFSERNKEVVKESGAGVMMPSILILITVSILSILV